MPVIAEMLIHFCFGKKRALLGQEISKGHAEFSVDFGMTCARKVGLTTQIG